MENGTSDMMGLSVGVDLVSVKRMEGVLQRWGDRFLNRVFTRNEIAYCMSRSCPARSLAGRFAAKEAFFKAVASAGVPGLPLKQIEVIVNAYGAPVLRARGRAVDALAGRKAALSISHDGEYAVALVATTG